LAEQEMSTHSDLPLITSRGAGVVELEFENLKQFVDYIYSDMLDFEPYIWRGQRCDTWELEPTLDRLRRTSKLPVAATPSVFAAKHLECFKYAVRGRRGPNPPAINDENDWWALGQHHGLATPLLDWSHSPFVAAFFAFNEVGADQTKHRAIYALHHPGVESTAKLKAMAEDERRSKEYEQRRKEGKLGLLDSALAKIKTQPEITFVRPLSDENSRLVSQRGLFTRNYAQQSIGSWINSNQEEDDNGWYLMKFLVPDAERVKCLQLLNRMNINPLSLFPDLSGASQYCNLLSQIDSY
jgi:hypothetical protein